MSGKFRYREQFAAQTDGCNLSYTIDQGRGCRVLGLGSQEKLFLKCQFGEPVANVRIRDLSDVWKAEMMN